MRTFSGPEQFDALKKTVVESYQKLFPVQKDTNGPSLHLNKIWVDDQTLDPHDYVDQKKTRLAGNTWGAPVYASIELKDPTGKVIDRMDKVRLATIPRLTPRGSYIVGGNEYQVSNQLRMKHGPYVLRTQKGDQYKAVLNLGGEFNKRAEIHFNPLNNKYTAKIDQSELPLYPLMHALGASDEQMRKEWGPEVFAANKVDPNKFLPRLANKLTRTKTDNAATAAEAIRSYAKTAVTDPNISEVTLGKSYDHLQHGMLLDTSKKLLHVYQEKEEPDDPENLLFKEVLSADDMLKDALSQKQKMSTMKYMLGRHLGKRTSIRDMIDFKKLSAPVEWFFTHDDRVSTPEQYNPVHMISETHKLTMMGTGGISDPHTIMPEIREVHPSHVGFVDPVHTPECYDALTEVFTKNGWKPWTNISSEDFFACRIDGELQFHKAEKIYTKHYKGLMYGAENSKLNYLVTPNHRMFVRPMESRVDAWRIESAEESHEKPRTFCTEHAPYVGSGSGLKELEKVASGNAAIINNSVNIHDWCELVGWFLSEGCATYNEDRCDYLVRISQSYSANPEKCRRIESLLNRLPWKWCQDTPKTSYAIGVKELAYQFRTQGYCDTKYIPEELFDAPLSARRLLLEALLLGDGRATDSHKKYFALQAKN